jgi:hypothetical protein
MIVDLIAEPEVEMREEEASVSRPMTWRASATWAASAVSDSIWPRRCG